MLARTRVNDFSFPWSPVVTPLINRVGFSVSYDGGGPVQWQFLLITLSPLFPFHHIIFFLDELLTPLASFFLRPSQGRRLLFVFD